MSNTFMAIYRDKDGARHEVPCNNLDEAMAFLRARIERVHDAVSGSVHEFEPAHLHPKTLAECHQIKLVACFTLKDEPCSIC
jgi:hypothetical protein